jgi:ketosteroid isomerase-like protein
MDSLADWEATRMTGFRHWLAAGVLMALGAHAAAGESQAPPAVPELSARCEVWQRELGFARAVAEHDAVAFAEYLHPRTAFGVGRTATVGRAEVTAQWQNIIDGRAVKLEWYPDVVTVGGDGRTAYSSGPTLYVDPKTGQARRGRFGSVWQRDHDGVWRVIFDDGNHPEPVDDAAVRAFHEGRRTTVCSTA